jgi:hypothetical protein
MVDKARESAANAGIVDEQLGRPGSPRCMFWPLVHLLRAIFHKDETGACKREDEAVDETRFEPAEVQEFHHIFLECSRWGQNSDQTAAEKHEEKVTAAIASPAGVSRSRRASLPSMNNTSNAISMVQPLVRAQPSGLGRTLPLPQCSATVDDSNLSVKECLGGTPSGVVASIKGIQVVLFSRRLHMRLSVDQRQELEQHAQKITGRKDGLADFADFLRLMKWALQTNFSKINEVAENAAVRERGRLVENEVVATVNCVSPTMSAKMRSQRRKSV